VGLEGAGTSTAAATAAARATASEHQRGSVNY
jgi:hypothetical protein